MSVQGRSTSEVWYHFTREEGKGRCRYCGTSIALSAGSTGNLKRHLSSKHPMVQYSRTTTSFATIKPVENDPTGPSTVCRQDVPVSMKPPTPTTNDNLETASKISVNPPADIPPAGQAHCRTESQNPRFSL